MNYKQIIEKICLLILSLVYGVLAFMEYLKLQSVYVGHFGNSLDFDWAMKPWYLIASIIFTFFSILEICIFILFRNKRNRFALVLFMISIFIGIVTFITIEIVLPYWFKEILHLNYGRGG